jgi:hypothetical protein
MVFIGIFSTANDYDQRAVVRALQTLPGTGNGKVAMKFILGQADDKRSQRQVEEEAARHGDIVFLDVTENMNNGKTYDYFKWLANRPPGERPRFSL